MDLRLRARRARLAERERQEYERERIEGRPEDTREALRPSRRAPRPRLAAIGWVVAQLLRLAALVEVAVATLLTTVVGLSRRALALAERHATPERVLVIVIGAAGGCLVASQFVAYRGVEVGQPQYAEVSAIAPPPQTDRIDAGAAHAYLLVPLAVLGVAIAVVALLSGRWRLARLVSLIGLAGITISLAIDLPKGLDAGTAGAAFAGAKATMTEGFYAQLAASAVLTLCGFTLGRDLRRGAGAGERMRRTWPSQPRARRAPSVAGRGA